MVNQGLNQGADHGQEVGAFLHMVSARTPLIEMDSDRESCV